MDSNGYWIPIIFSSLTLVFWFGLVLVIYFDTHAFDPSRDSCYRSDHVFTEQFLPTHFPVRFKSNSWADKFWAVGLFSVKISAPILVQRVPCPFFFIIQPLFLQKTKPLYPHLNIY